MVSFKDKIFLVYGNDFSRRRLIVDNIIKKIFPKKEALSSILTFYAKEIDIKDLQEKFFIASFDKLKILVFKDTDSLSKEVKVFLLDNFSKILSGNYLIFEMEKDYSLQDKKVSSDAFFKFIFSNARLCRANMGIYKVNFDDFKQSIRKQDLASSLYILNKLFEDRASDNEKKILGLQIFGLLVSEFSYIRNATIRKKCMDYLWQTDRTIKEKGFEPRLAIELLLSKAFVR